MRSATGAAPVRAVLHVRPVTFPLLTPLEGAAAPLTDLRLVAVLGLRDAGHGVILPASRD